RGVAFGGERDAVAEFAFADLPAPGELSALLGPGRARAREDPRRPNSVVKGGAADQRGGAGACGDGERHVEAEDGLADFSRRLPLFARLGPGRARAGEDPRRADERGVGLAADQRGVAFVRERRAEAEFACAGLSGAGELRALLSPGRARAREDP